MMKKIALVALAAALLIMPCLAASHSTQRIGIVNVMRIMSGMPEFQQYSQQYSQERSQLLSGKLDAKRRGEVAASMKKWDSVKQKFIDSTMGKVKSAAQKVAQQDKLDYVLVDAPWNPGYPLAQEGAVDVTTDVMFAMQGK